MQKLYIISTCLLYKKNYSEFHFKGYFKGQRVNKVRIYKGLFKMNENYLLKLKKPVVEEQVLYAECVKYKRLFS